LTWFYSIALTTGLQEAGTALPSLAADCLENFETGLKESAATPEEKDHIIRWTAGVMYAAGGESVSHPRTSSLQQPS
jgi:hypothetical protein